MFRPHRGSRLGTRFGPYELQSLLGAGVMGEVYRAYDTTKNRTVAVKLLRPEFAADLSFQERFAREYRMAARLQNPHVIPLHDFGLIDGVPFIDMRLVDGGNLRELLRERGALDPRQAASVTAQVAAALDAAHAEGLVHGGVQPENVLLTGDGFAYLSDFGIAQADGSYMAPERFSGGEIGPQSDIYSLACMLYECLTGDPPFEGADVRELADAHTHSPAPRPSIMRRGIPKAIDDVVAIGMAKQPAERFSSARELADAATAAASGDRVVVSPSPPSTRPFAVSYPNPEDTGSSPYPPLPVAARAWRPARAPLVLGGVAVVMLIVAAGLAVILALGGGRNNRSPQTPTAAPPAMSSAPTTTKTTMPSLSRPVQGADGLGFVGHSARCDVGNPPAAVVRTAKSLAVVCQRGPDSFYYRGERIRDGANIELPNAIRAAGGFDVTNPADGTRYEVGPKRLRIISNGHVDSSERVLQYATAT
ncbi:protein kinase [Mycobacterium sp. 1164966.3]|uniref:serine/threonine-protein kinase n=1 Tax=Mycobacterium sp. 1164966.3 TaxID=1856861 RepID=UPI0007FDA14B|nr:serine/threonine-protein kinase [Mycobacterium sp. 1164966.3]OBA82436.1 protein kinase [Mycobacterium sp. 1164966.3]